MMAGLAIFSFILQAAAKRSVSEVLDGFDRRQAADTYRDHPVSRARFSLLPTLSGRPGNHCPSPDIQSVVVYVVRPRAQILWLHGTKLQGRCHSCINPFELSTVSMS